MEEKIWIELLNYIGSYGIRAVPVRIHISKSEMVSKSFKAKFSFCSNVFKYKIQVTHFISITHGNESVQSLYYDENLRDSRVLMLPFIKVLYVHPAH